MMNITPKVFRKSLATLVADAGIPEIALQKLLGHVPGSPVTAKYYTKPVDATVLRAANIVRLSPNIKVKAEEEVDSSDMAKTGNLR